MAMEIASPLPLSKGDVPDLVRKPLDALWFQWNSGRASALDTTYLLPVFGQFRDIT
jgi:hypothetical protein